MAAGLIGRSVVAEIRIETNPRMANRAKSDAESLDVRRHLLELIGRPDLPFGRLPPEREISEKLQVGRGVTRRVLDDLRREGLIYRHVGRGTFVGRAEENPVPTVSQLSDAVRDIHEPSRGAASRAAYGTGAEAVLLDAPGPIRRTPWDYLEARLRFEPELAWMIVAHATNDDLARIEGVLTQAEAATTTQQFVEADTALHQAMADATHNSLTVDMYRVIDQTRRAEHSQWPELHGPEQSGEMRAIFNREHREIFTALVNRDARAARDAWSLHIRNTRKRIVDY